MDEYKIERLGLHGDGVASGPVHVPFALPGELVTGTLVGDVLENMRVSTPSADRVAPACRHFKSCGGCSMQHAADPLVADWKTDIVRRSLKMRGLETDILDIATSPDRSRLRAGFAARRTKKGAMAGFHARSSDVIVEVANCTLIHPDLHKGREVVAALARYAASRKGELSAMVTLSAAGLDVVVTGGKPLDGALRLGLGQFVEQHGLARLTWDDETIAMRAAPVQVIGNARVVPPPGAFMQATAHGAETLTKAVLDIVGDSSKVADLFAGCGTFALPLAQKAEVFALEGEAEMIAALDRGWRETPGLKTIVSATRDLFRRPLLPDELNKFDAVVIDPPRAGAEAQIAQVAKSDVPLIAYVSCNPVSFARDAEKLVEAGFKLEWVLPVDQFRWSAHVELVGKFAR